MTKGILVVDDEEDIRDSVKTLFESEGFRVETASNGLEASKILKGNADFDLILIDFFMPGISGRELLKKIREDSKLKELKCAFLTVAEFSGKGIDELKKLHSLDYIKKPYDSDDLVERVKKMVG